METDLSFPLQVGGGPPSSLIRPPAHYRNQPTLDNINVTTTIAFYHPGHSAYQNGATPSPDNYHSVNDLSAEIFRLPCYDNAGLHHGTALAACLIIAGNKPGYLTTSTPNGTRVRDPLDTVLRADVRYYYHLDESTETPYSICPSFTEWKFDPRVIPSAWMSAFENHTTNPIVTPSQMSAGVHMRDVSCRITDSRDLTETAHIIPKTERDWFSRNAMHRYNSSPQSHIDDVRNGFLMRRDLKMAFEKGMFCLVVKEGRVVCQFLERTYEIGGMYHNTAVRMPEGVAVEFMWARFAWCVLPLAGGFVKSRGGRVDIRVAVGGGEEEVGRPGKKRKKGGFGGQGQGGQSSQGQGGLPPRVQTGGGKMFTMMKVELVQVGEPINNPSQRSSPSSLDSIPIASTSLEQEREEDMRTKECFFPLMNEETTWSTSYTWQSAPWYPGISQTERLKTWWREQNPQVGMVKGGVEE